MNLLIITNSVSFSSLSIHPAVKADIISYIPMKRKLLDRENESENFAPDIGFRTR